MYFRLVIIIFFCSFNVKAVDYEINLVGKDLNQFIVWFSDTTKSTVILDKDIDGTVSVFARSGVKSRTMLNLFVNVLNSQGLSYRFENGIYRVYKTKLNLMPLDIKTEFYDFANISGTHVESLVPVIDSLINNLIDNKYLSEDKKSINSKSLKYSVESLFSGRSLLITAPVFIHSHLKSIIKRMDRLIPQVLVKMVVVESLSTDLFQVGMDWGITSGNATLKNSNSFSLDESLALLIDNVGFSSAIALIDKTDNVKIKSMPQLLVLHGSEGVINVGQNVPFITGSVVTSGANAGNPYQTITREDVGLILSVKPFVSGKNVHLDISQELSSISEDIEASDIVTDKRRVTTALNIKSGTSVVLGGLVSEFKTDTVTGVPLLMDIPYLGRAFSSVKEKISVRNLSLALEVTVL